MANILEVLVDIKSRLAGADESIAKVQVLRAETEKLTLAGQNRAGALNAFAAEEAARSAALTQQVAIESQLQVIAQTKADIAAAQVKGDTAQVALLNSELKIRTSTLGVMRAEVLTAAQLNALTEEESALLSIAAFKSNEIAGGGLLAGASLNKAKGEAIVLAREIATGSVNARTMGALLGSLGNTLTIAGIAGFVLFQAVSHSADEAVRLAQEGAKETTELSKQAVKWQELARAASNFGDVVKLGENITPELDKLSAKLAEFRNKELTLTQKFLDLLPPLQPFGADGKETPDNANRQRLDEAIHAQAVLVANAIRLGVANQEAADKAVAAWDKLRLGPLNEGVEKQTEILDQAKEKYAALIAQRNTLLATKLVDNPNDPGALAAAAELSRQIDEAGRNILLQKTRVDQLTQSQTKLAAESDRVAAAIKAIDFKQLDNKGQLDSLNADLVRIQDDLRKVGVEAASPNEALKLAEGLTEKDKEAVIRLASAWAQVIAAINGASNAQAQLSSQLASFNQGLAVINAQAFGTRVDAFNEKWKKDYGEILALREKIGADTSGAAINDQIFAQQQAAERLKQWSTEDREATAGTAAGHQQITAFMREESTLLQGIRQQQQLIAGKPFLTVDQKNAQLLALMQQEIAAVNAEVAKGQALLSGGTLDPATYEKVAQKVQQATFQVELLRQKMSELDPGGGLKANLFSWVNSFGSTAQQVGNAITGSIGSAIDGISSGITDLIFHTGNFGQTMLRVAQQVVGSLIKIGLQMIAQKVLGSLLGKTATAEQTANNAEVLSSATPAAVAQSGATSGFNWVFAGIAAAAAIALIIGLLAGGFEKGGYTGLGGRAAIAGIVHGQEYVQPKDTVDYYGLPFMAALHQRRIPASRVQELIGNYRHSGTPRFGSFEVGGAVAAMTESSSRDSSAAGSPLIGDIKAVVVNDVTALRKVLLNSDEAIQFVIDAVNGNVHLIRKRA